MSGQDILQELRQAVFRVTENGESMYFSVPESVELLQAAAHLRNYLSDKNAGTKFTAIFPHGEKITQEQFDAAELLIRVLVSLEAKITEKDLDVETELPDGPVMVWGDPDAVTQVCYNLLDNAVKFSFPKGKLTLKITSKAGKAYISIGNQGETIPPDQLSHIFDRFHKADSSRSTHKDGVGLGLYIVKTILNTYKEDITVTSQDGFTEFTFTLSEV